MKVRDRAALRQNSNPCPRACSPASREPKWSVPSTLFGSCPRASITSISPDAAQPPYFSSCGSIQSAGQTPLPVGSLARNSNLPYFLANNALPSRFRGLQAGGRVAAAVARFSLIARM